MPTRRGSSASARVPVANHLLAALPAEDYRRLAPSLEIVPLPLKQILYKPGEVIDGVYFPGGGFLSVLTVLANGDMVEVATIGREGMVGVSATTPGTPEPSLTMVQAEVDTCYRMKAAVFRREMEQSGAFREVVGRYGQVLFGLIMQSTACNVSHSVEQRLARWLLMAHDRVGKDEFPLTQEFVAMMLGAARPTVTVVAGTLQRAGLITYRRGRLSIVNRRGLEQAACECYRATTDALDRMRPRPRR